MREREKNRHEGANANSLLGGWNRGKEKFRAHGTGGLHSHPTHSSRDAACGDAKLVPLGKLARIERALRQSSQNRIALITGLLKMLVIAHRPRAMFRMTCCFGGGPLGVRTLDLGIKSPLLCQLS